MIGFLEFQRMPLNCQRMLVDGMDSSLREKFLSVWSVQIDQRERKEENEKISNEVKGIKSDRNLEVKLSHVLKDRIIALKKFISELGFQELGVCRDDPVNAYQDLNLILHDIFIKEDLAKILSLDVPKEIHAEYLQAVLLILRSQLVKKK